LALAGCGHGFGLLFYSQYHFWLCVTYNGIVWPTLPWVWAYTVRVAASYGQFCGKFSNAPAAYTAFGFGGVGGAMQAVLARQVWTC